MILNEKFFHPRWREDILEIIHTLPPIKSLIAIYFGCLVFTLCITLSMIVLLQSINVYSIFYRISHGVLTDLSILDMNFQGWKTVLFFIKSNLCQFIAVLMASNFLCSVGFKIKKLIYRDKAVHKDGKDFTIGAIFYFMAILIGTMSFTYILTMDQTKISLILPFTIFMGTITTFSLLLALAAYETLLGNGRNNKDLT